MQWFVAWHGKPVKSVKTGFASALRIADIEDEGISPHTFRHTAATWLMLEGVSTFKAAGFLGVGEETLRRVYGHHHPDYQADEADALGYAAGRNGVARRAAESCGKPPPEANEYSVSVHGNHWPTVGRAEWPWNLHLPRSQLEPRQEWTNVLS